MPEEKLFNPDLRWHPGTGEMTPAQLAAIHTRHSSAIRPIPSATALGHEHVMADADRGALLAELNRAMEEAYRLREERDRFRNMMNSAVSAGVVLDGERLDALREAGRLQEENERLSLEVGRSASGARVTLDAGVAYAQEVKRLEGIVASARALHGPDDPEFLEEQGWAYCYSCQDIMYPCETRKALDKLGKRFP